MTINVKRAYEPAEDSDGTRVLIDRLWPRGISKDQAAIDAWVKEIAPSDQLRQWFHEDKEQRFDEFKRRYRQELEQLDKEALQNIPESGKLTLVTAVKNVETSHIPVLVEFLETQRK